MGIAKADTDNTNEYALTCNQIRDFCRDAIDSGRVPEDWEIDNAVGRYLAYANKENE